MNNRKKNLIGAAVSGILSVGLVSGAAYAKAKTAAPTPDDATKGKCYGPNSCSKGADGKHKCAAGKCNSKDFEMMTKAECDKKGAKYRFEKPVPTTPTKQNKAENNVENTEVDQDADPRASDDAPYRDPHE